MDHYVIFFNIYIIFNLKLRVNLKFYKKVRGIHVIVSLLTFKIQQRSLN
jgi:hypothetical protein